MADDLDVYLNSVLPAQLEAQLSDAIREEAQDLSDAQRDALRAQEQPPEETGELEASCQVIPGATALEYFVQAGGVETTGDIREGSSEPFDYAVGFEFGTSRQVARPFFWNTYRGRRDRMQENINEAISEVLK